MRKVGKDFYVGNEQYALALERIEPHSYERYVGELARACGVMPVLDDGCGTGAAVQLLLERGCDAYGCDVSPDFIALATERAGPHFALVNDDGSLPYADAAFGAAGSFNVLEHVEKPSLFLDELCRVVRPGGTLVLATPNMLSISWPRPRLGVKNPWHIRLMNLGLLARRAVGDADKEFISVECRLDMADFQPDFDAICLTNYFDIRRALRRRGCRIISYSATQRRHAGIAGRVVDLAFATPLGWLLGGVFVIAVKRQLNSDS